VLGKKGLALTASATAIAQEGMITDIKSINGMNGPLLPVAEDVTIWTDFFTHGVNSPDADPNAPSGQAWLQIYPGGSGDTMAGLLSLDGSKAPSNGPFVGGGRNGGWIQAGASPADIISLHTAGDLPLPTSGAGKTWAAGPGVKSDVLHDFQALVTDPPTLRLLPLFDPDSLGTTSGGNGTYEIVYLVPVYVVYAEGHGRTNMDIAVVPAAGSPIYDPTLVISGTTRMGTSTTSSRFLVPTPAKLTQ